MKAVVAILLCAAAVQAIAPLSETEYQQQFVDFVQKFDKTYAHEDFFNRFNIFKGWVDFVRDHNENAAARNLTWTAGINQFSDLTPAEFKALYLSGLIIPADASPAAEQIMIQDPSMPNDIDWRSKGAVTPVKNQGQCGSCWSFSATGAVEGWAAVTKGSLPNLSEQQLIDCSGSVGNQGCNGGWPSKTIGYMATTGAADENAYPYKARQAPCKQFSPVVRPNGVRTGSGESTLASQLGSMPVSVCVDATSSFQAYHSGVFNGPCGSQINHAVLAVGYTADYWIVKNSWGTSWGSSGYIYMARGKNLCAIGSNLAWAY